MADGPFKIVYNSDLVIRDRSEAASLCVFYDKIFLPFTSPQTCNNLAGLSAFTTYHQDTAIKDWDLEYRTLFDAGVLDRLPAFREHYVEVPTWSWQPLAIALRPAEIPDDARMENDSTPWGEILPGDRVVSRQHKKVVMYSPKVDIFSRQKWTMECEVEIVAVQRQGRKTLEASQGPLDISFDDMTSILKMPVRTVKVGDSRYMSRDLATHLVRPDLDMPQIFMSVKGQPIGREVLVALEAEATFKYLLPKLNIFHATQILELREKVAATREGFTMHLWKLSKGLEDRAKQGTSIHEIAGFAKNLVETDLIPDYREFSRQLASIKAGKWNKFLAAAGKISEIDAAPWTPKFYATLLKALGLSVITVTSEQTETLTNKYQAFKFMSQVEGMHNKSR